MSYDFAEVIPRFWNLIFLFTVLIKVSRRMQMMVVLSRIFYGLPQQGKGEEFLHLKKCFSSTTRFGKPSGSPADEEQRSCVRTRLESAWRWQTRSSEVGICSRRCVHQCIEAKLDLKFDVSWFRELPARAISQWLTFKAARSCRRPASNWHRTATVCLMWALKIRTSVQHFIRDTY